MIAAPVSALHDFTRRSKKMFLLLELIEREVSVGEEVIDC